MLTGLSKICKAARSGLRTVRYAPTTYFDKSRWNPIPNPATNSLHNLALYFNAGKYWLEAPLQIDKNSFKETNQKPVDGNMYNYSLTGFLPQHSELIQREINEMERYRFVVWTLDEEGASLVAGNPYVGCEFLAELTPSPSPGSARGYNLTFNWSSDVRLPGYAYLV